jgi:hypothetical protein
VRKTYVGVKVDVSFDPEVASTRASVSADNPQSLTRAASRGSCPTPRRLTTSSHRCSIARQAR